jgi:hypothetical protein
MAPGSYLVISHTADEATSNVIGAAKQGFSMAGAPLTPRPGPAPEIGTAGTPDLPWTIVGGVAAKP